MRLQIYRRTPNMIQVQTDNCLYTVYREGDTITLLGPGLQEEYENLELPYRPSLPATAAYLVASLETQIYGD